MEDVLLLSGDWRDYTDEINRDRVSAVISDPPYGANVNCDYRRFSGGKGRRGKEGTKFDSIIGDGQEFDPAPWLDYPQVILWGYQFFAQRLPVGTVLVWNKRRDNMLGAFMSDCELAWQKGNKGCYLFHHEWSGFLRDSEKGEKTLHPSQKPVPLMEWCIERCTKEGDVVLDPYMGSGATGIACARTGRKFIGIEIHPPYYEIARDRVLEAYRQRSLF